MMDGSVALVAPVIVVFQLLQRHFTQTIAMSRLTG